MRNHIRTRNPVMLYAIFLTIILLTEQSFAMSFFFPPEKPKIKIPVYTPPKPKRQPMACLSKNEMINRGIFYCPRPNELVKKGMKWSAKDPWKAYSESFVDRIDRFTGAQWSSPLGAMGRLICFYEGMQKDTFPVKITTTVLISKPTLPLWEIASKPSDSTMIYNCVTPRGEVCDCPFSISKTSANPEKNEIPEQS